MFARIFGPLHRFRWAFEGIGVGEVTRRVRLRRGDALIPEADAFNVMMDQLSERIRPVQEASDTVLKGVRQLAAAAEAADAAKEIAPLAADLAQRMRGIDDQLRDFILAPLPADAPDPTAE